VNAPLDDKALDEYLTRGSEVSRHYRELDGDTVPPELDRRVLAEARAAASGNQSGGRAWMRWSAPVALAASAVLVLSILVESGVEQEPTLTMPQSRSDARPAKTEVPKPQAATRTEAPVEVFTGLVPDATFEPQAPPEAPAPAPASQPRDLGFGKQAQKEARLSGLPSEERIQEIRVTASARSEVMMDSPGGVERSMVSPTAAPSEVNAPSAVEEAVVTGNRRSEERRSVGPRDTLGAGIARSNVQEEESYRTLQKNRTDPERWLEEIRQLRRDRKSRDADIEWEQFRKQFPDYPVAEDDIAAKRP
jgi:hypothetical protein